MRKIIRISSFIILIIMIFSFLPALSSCKEENPDEATTQTDPVVSVTEAQTEDISVKKSDLSNYKLVRPFLDKESAKDAAVWLNRKLNEVYSITLGISDDYIDAGAEHDDNAYEILVGKTNYTQSTAALEEVTKQDFIIKFVGNKILIMGGCKEKTQEAVEYFVENYLRKDDETVKIVSEADFSSKYSYKYAEADITVSSLNLRTADYANENMQAEREPLIAAYVASYAPYSIGVQECEVFWRIRLDAVLTGYSRAQQVLPNVGTKNYIYYKTDKLKTISSGIFWLSETPDEKSKGFGSNFYISCCWAIFEELETGSRYVHMNTHLDVNSEQTRMLELAVLLERAKAFIDEGYSVVITGDFNARTDSPIYASMLENNYLDTQQIADKTMSIGTFNAFNYDREYSGPIDYCFVNNLVSATEYKVIPKWEEKFMSDHNALFMRLTVYKR